MSVTLETLMARRRNRPDERRRLPGMDSSEGITAMPGNEHEHPGQNEPRAHRGTYHENRIVDLNTASEDELSNLPMVGPERARNLMQHRPFQSWQDVERVPGFSKGVVDDLKSGGAQIGAPT
jgi:DNA uptake protein ComE-like DNA-binding protein